MDPTLLHVNLKIPPRTALHKEGIEKRGARGNIFLSPSGYFFMKQRAESIRDEGWEAREMPIGDAPYEILGSIPKKAIRDNHALLCNGRLFEKC